MKEMLEALGEIRPSSMREVGVAVLLSILCLVYEFPKDLVGSA
jgi:hypothetical protein